MNEFSRRIAAVICSYNRKFQVNKCVESLLRQTYELEKIIVVDNNSQDGTTSFLEEKYKFNPAIEIINLKTNVGSAGAFYEGIKKALKEKFDWIWLMDDDAEASPDALEKLSNFFYLKRNNVLGFASLIIEDGKVLPNRGVLDLSNFWPLPFKPIKLEDYKNKKLVKIDFAASIGLLVATELVERGGLPNRKLFLYGDDTEWMIRIKKFGKIILVTDSIVRHNNPESVKFKKFFHKKYHIIPFEKFGRYYFTYRNLIAIGKKYHTNHFKFYIGFLGEFFKLFVGIILFDDYKLKRFFILLRAINDGFKFNLDN